MANSLNWAVRIAQSEMSRNALNSWDKFKLADRNPRIDSLMLKLQATGPAIDTSQRRGGRD